MYRSGRWSHKAPDYSNMTEPEIFRHFEKEQKRFDNGYRGLDGDYYMYLTQFMIRHRDSGQQSYPDDMEVYREIIFPWLKKCEKDSADGLWITQRGAGKSTVMSGYLPLRTAIKYAGSKTIMTSDCVTNTKNNFSEKLKVAWDGMHHLFRPSLIDGQFPNEKNDNQYVKFGVRGKGNKSDGGSGSIIQSIETSYAAKSPNKLEGQGAKTVILDELFKHPYANDVKSRASPLVRNRMRKTGSIYYVGSLSDATAKGLQNAVDMWNTSKATGLEALFVDATWFNEYIEDYDKDGNKLNNKYIDVTRKNGSIDRAKAKEQILKIRRALEKLPTKKPLMEYMLMYPLYINELLDVMTDSWWGDDELMMFQEQKKVVQQALVKKDYSQVDRGAILYDSPENDKVSISYDVKREHSKYFLFEHPIEGRTYGVGVDTTPNVSEKETGSFHAAVVKCFDTNQYVGLYFERSSDIMLLAEKTIRLQKLYHNAPALVERNSIGALKLAYDQLGLKGMLAKNPKRFRPKGQKHIETGLNKDRNTPELRQLLRMYIAKNMYNMHIEQFFKELLLFPFENTDMMDAMAMCEALHEDYMRLDRKAELANKINQSPIRYVTGRDGVRRIQTSVNHISRDGTLDITALISKK